MIDGVIAMFDKFTESARKVMGYARQQARELKHEYIGTEHLLLAIAENYPQILKEHNLDAENVKKLVHQLSKPGDSGAEIGQMPFTPRAKRALELTAELAAAKSLKDITPKELFYGVMAEGVECRSKNYKESTASIALRAAGADLEKIVDSYGLRPKASTEPQVLELAALERIQQMGYFPKTGPKLEPAWFGHTSEQRLHGLEQPLKTLGFDDALVKAWLTACERFSRDSINTAAIAYGIIMNTPFGDIFKAFSEFKIEKTPEEARDSLEKIVERKESPMELHKVLGHAVMLAYADRTKVSPDHYMLAVLENQNCLAAKALYEKSK